MYSSIVVGTDGSETAGKAVSEAIALAKSSGAKLHVVTAFQDGTIRRTQRELASAHAEISSLSTPRDAIDASASHAAHLARGQGVDVETHVLHDDPTHALIEVASDSHADLIVVGNKGMSGAKRALGSVPNKVTHRAPCSVLVVQTT
jgi:nucleotide-binding universal stress UspA family protein